MRRVLVMAVVLAGLGGACRLYAQTVHAGFASTARGFGVFHGGFRGNHHFHGIRGGFWGFPFFADDFAAVAPSEPEVIILRDEDAAHRPAVEPPLPSPQAKMIEVPVVEQKKGGKTAFNTPTVVVFRSGQQLKVARYTIMGGFLYDSSQPRQTNRIPLEQLDLHATAQLNAMHGIKFQVPVDSNEVVVQF